MSDRCAHQPLLVTSALVSSNWRCQDTFNLEQVIRVLLFVFSSFLVTDDCSKEGGAQNEQQEGDQAKAPSQPDQRFYDLSTKDFQF